MPKIILGIVAYLIIF